MKTKSNVLISDIGIPSSTIGSWNVLFTNLINKDASVFTHIISPKPSKEVECIQHMIVKEPSFAVYKIGRFIKFYSKKVYWNSLKNIILKETDNVIVVNIVDNLEILLAIDFLSRKEGLRDRIHIIFFQRGFNFRGDSEKKYDAMDQLILMSHSSYLDQVKHNHAISCEVKLLRNGIDSSVFFPLEEKEKIELRKQLNFSSNKTYFLWVSQDRPKKGLRIVLKAWKELIKNNSNLELIIIGTHDEVIGQQITWLGRKANNVLAQYYQATDYYLFSSLCHEGQPRSLTEALKCGAKCLASNIDPISEVLHEGNLGLLVDYPNFVNSWVEAINYVLKTDVNFNKENLDLLKLYDFEDWSKEIKKIFND